MSNTYLSDEDYDFIYSRSPRICVDLLIRTDNGILLTKRTIEPYKDHWHLPGGRIRFRETIQEAVTRISKSELNVEMEGIYPIMGVIQFLEEVQNGSPRHSISIVHGISTQPIFDLDENTQYFKTLPEDMIPEQRNFIIKEIKKQRGE